MHKSIYLEKISEDNLNKISGLGLTSIIVPSTILTKESIDLIKRILKGTEVYADFSVFEGTRELVEKYPDILALEVEGKETQTEDYIAMCVTHPKLMDEVLARFRKVLELDIAGVWFSNLHYPTKWNVENPDILDTCYCERCLRLFEDKIGEPIQGMNLEEKYLHIDGSFYHEWLLFKSEQIENALNALKSEIVHAGKQLKTGIFVIPWEEKDYRAGIKRIVAQDFEKLVDMVDTLSPMFFYNDLKKPIDWVGEMVDYFWNLGTTFLPLVKVEKASDISGVVEQAVKSPSEGVIVQPEFDENLTEEFVEKLKKALE